MICALIDSHVFRLIAFSDNRTGFFPLCRLPGKGLSPPNSTWFTSGSSIPKRSSILKQKSKTNSDSLTIDASNWLHVPLHLSLAVRPLLRWIIMACAKQPAIQYRPPMKTRLNLLFCVRASLMLIDRFAATTAAAHLGGSYQSCKTVLPNCPDRAPTRAPPRVQRQTDCNRWFEPMDRHRSKRA
jgi:hypothetical protein